MPSSLTTLLPKALGFSPHLPVSVYGTGAIYVPHTFSRQKLLLLPYYNFQSLSPGATNARVSIYSCVSVLKYMTATEFQPSVHRLRLAASP